MNNQDFKQIALLLESPGDLGVLESIHRDLTRIKERFNEIHEPKLGDYEELDELGRSIDKSINHCVDAIGEVKSKSGYSQIRAGQRRSY